MRIQIKKAYLALALKPVGGLLIECYADAETGDELDLLFHGLIGYQNDLFQRQYAFPNGSGRKRAEDGLGLRIGKVD